MPVLEAMASGVPVITSNVSSLPEVADGAGILINPKNHAELTRSINNLLVKEKLRKLLIQKGLIQAQKFSWEISAKKAIKTLENL